MLTEYAGVEASEKPAVTLTFTLDQQFDYGLVEFRQAEELPLA